MAHHVEPMDIDSSVCDFDNKENSIHHSNVPRTPCTEKGYEELDVTELNMRLRYSITPASSPMSKSFTANCLDNRNSDNTMIGNDNGNLTRSFNSNMTKNDTTMKSQKILPLQALPTDLDSNRNPLRSIDSTATVGNVTVIVSQPEENDENISFPSSSSSTAHTPEATTPTKDIPKDDHSPIMRGLKSVLNMFRPSQSPIPPTEDEKNALQPEVLSPPVIISPETADSRPISVLASTPLAAHRSKDSLPKRLSPNRDSLVFNDDLEKELQWKDDSTIIFSKERIPIHKLFFPQTKPFDTTKNVNVNNEEKKQEANGNINTTVEYMDISYNDSVDKTITEKSSDRVLNKSEANIATESDSEFLDCETTFSKNDSHSEISFKSQEEIFDLCDDINIPDFKEVPNLDTTEESLNATVSAKSVDVSITSTESIKGKIYIASFETVPVPQKADDVFRQEEFEVKQVPCAVEDHKIVEECAALPESKLELTVDSNVTKCIETTVVHKDDNVNHVLKSNVDHVYQPNFNSVQNNDNNFEKVHEIADVAPTPELGISTLSQIPLIVDPRVLLFNIPSQIPNDEIEAQQGNVDVNLNTSPADIPLPDDDEIEKTLPSAVLKEDIIVNCNIPSTLSQDLDQNIMKLQDNDANLTKNVCSEVDNNVANDAASIPEVEAIPVNIKALSEVCETGSDNLSLVDHNIAVEEKINEESQEKISEENSEAISAMSPLFSPSLSNIDNQCSEVNNTAVTTTHEKDVHTNKVTEPEVAPANNVFEDKSLGSDNVCIKQIPQITSMVNMESGKLDATSDGVNQVNDVNTPKETSFLENKEITACDREIANETIEVIIPEKNTVMFAAETNTASQTIVSDSNVIHINSTVDTTVAVTEKNENKMEDENNTNQLEVINKPTNEPGIAEPILFSNEIVETFSMGVDVAIIAPEMTNVESIVTSEEPLVKEEQPNDYEPLNNNESGMEITDEEIVASENNSPFVSVTAEKLTLEEKLVQKFKEIENPIATTNVENSPPSSPVIATKGYNFNFDEIEDPFATKTKIRMSPPPLASPNQSFNQFEQKPEVAKKDVNRNRRKSQPERKKPSIPSKKMNSTLDAAIEKKLAEKTTVAQPFTVVEDKVDSNKPNSTTDDNSVTTPIEQNKGENQEIVDKKGNETITEDESEKVLNLTSGIASTSLNIQKSTEKMSKEDNNSSIEFVTTPPNEIKTTSSSEQSAYYSAGTSSNEGIESRNVFNVPEINDMNFNPFATKTKIRQSPPPSLEIEDPFITKSNIRSSPVSFMTPSLNDEEDANTTINLDADKLLLNDKNSSNDKTIIEQEKNTSDNINSSSSSKTTDDVNVTVRTVRTEDEDTIEGPFLEAEDLIDDKMSDFDGENVDMMRFSNLPAQDIDNTEPGELFIDAEAFEFLLNQNNPNMVSESGKESLFLKFDPLFAKRLSSSGVVAALSKVQKRQSTPKKISKPSETFVMKSPTAGPSALNETHEMDMNNVTEESNDDLNVTVSKPMMVVNPAVNPVVTPRNKTVTPLRSNRRSLTFTSPAIAVIDRLLSMSANNSLMGHDTTVAEINREQQEADLALTQLRELLADKEINVYNLRSESKELKDRLASLESQMKTLESISEERLKKINALAETLNEKTKINKRMERVVEEYERTIASLIAETEQDKKRHAEERIQLIKERDEQTNHLASMEVSFSDLHSKYEKSKQVILSFKANEDSYKKSIKDFEENLSKMQTNYELLKQHATSKLNHANDELQKMNRAHEAEILKLNAMIKRKELHITSLEETLSQKTKANEELTAICDELINKVG